MVYDLRYTVKSYLEGNRNFPIRQCNTGEGNVETCCKVCCADCFSSDINAWDVTGVKDFSGLFEGSQMWTTGAEIYFNDDINGWDVSGVTNMGGMFGNNKIFDKPLSNWDVGSVTNMRSMFTYTDVFNQDINAWDVAAVTSMQSMFEAARVFNQPLTGWDVSAVINYGNMLYMFDGAWAQTSLPSWYHT
jgi:surface protein